MSLEELLRALFDAHLEVAVVDGAPKLRGPTAEIGPELVAACTEHRAALIRIHREPGAVAEWRQLMWASGPDLRAAWAEVAAGLEAEGLCAAGAEYLAWQDVGR